MEGEALPPPPAEAQAHAPAKLPGSDHVVPLPSFVFFIRIAQAVIALLIMALAAASINALYPWTSVGESFTFMIFIVWSLGFILFVSIATVIVAVYLIVSSLAFAAIYNCWAALLLEVLGVIAWLIVFAIMTAWAAANKAAKLVNSSLGSGSVLYSGPGAKSYYDSAFSRYGWKTTAAASGLGGLELILFLITLIIFTCSLQKHRKSGAPSRGPKSPGTGTNGNPPAEAGSPYPIEMNPIETNPIRTVSPSYGMNDPVLSE